MPPHIHARIMKRVFFAEYGKYLIFSSGILAINLCVLGIDLYRAFSSEGALKALKNLGDSFALTPSYLASAASTIYGILPFQSLVASALAIAFAIYITTVFMKIYRNPEGIKLVS